MHSRYTLCAVAAAAVLSACTTDLPTANPADAVVAKGGGGGGGTKQSLYSFTMLQLPAGATVGRAAGVNSAKLVVGNVTASAGWRAVVWFGDGAPIILDPNADSHASAISEGRNPYVIGWVSVNGNSAGVRWTLDTDTRAVTNTVMVGWPEGVNDGGDVIGRDRIRLDNGSVITIDNPGTFAAVSGTDINNDGHAVFNATGGGQPGRAFVRLATGAVVQLDPPAAMAGDTSFAAAISEVVIDSQDRSIAYVAGKIQISSVDCVPVRWTVDVTNGVVLSTEIRNVSGSAWGIDNQGTAVGHYGQRWSSTGFAWAGTTLTNLPLPKGTKNGHAYGINPGGEFIAGYGEQRLGQFVPVVWTRLP